MKILLADDSNLILERLSEVLVADKQLEIVAVLRNGTDTLKAIRTLHPDIAIIDIRMPGLNGIEVLTEIKKEESHTKFIILSFYSSDYYRKLANHAGADYFFNKADEFDKVFLAVNDILSISEKESKNGSMKLTHDEKSVRNITNDTNK